MPRRAAQKRALYRPLTVMAMGSAHPVEGYGTDKPIAQKTVNASMSSPTYQACSAMLACGAWFSNWRNCSPDRCIKLQWSPPSK